MRGVEKKNIRRGCIIAAVGSASLTKKVKAVIYVYDKEESGRSTGFKKSYKPQFYIKSGDVT